MHIKILFIGITLFVSSALAEDVPEKRNTSFSMPMVTLGGTQYYIGNSFKATWFEALFYCRSHGLDLISIETKKQYNQLVKYLKEKDLNKKGHRWWMSGTDNGEEGTFVWMGTGLEVKFADWAPTQPDNKDGKENCLQLWNPWSNVVRWNDEDCASKEFFICQLLSSPTS